MAKLHNHENKRVKLNNDMFPDRLVPNLLNEIEIVPMDTAFHPSRYLVKAGEGKNLEISETYYHLIGLIDGKRSVEEISIELKEKFSIDIPPHEIKRIIETSLVSSGIAKSDLNGRKTTHSRSYLSYKHPLLLQRSLLPFTKMLQILFEKHLFTFLVSVALVFEILFYFVFRDPLISIIKISGNDLIISYIVFFLSSLFHELGHLSACQRYGALYKEMGIGIYFYFPVFYSDVTDAWKLKRKQRAVVDFGGVYFQLLLLPFLQVLHVITGSAAFIFVIYFLNLNIAATLNPFLRFDGYWLLSDLLGVPNLRKRSKEMVTYWSASIFRKRAKKPYFMSKLQERTLYYLFTYTIVCNIFFIFFAIRLLDQFTLAMFSYHALINDVAVSYREGVGAFFSSITKFFFVNFIIFSVGLMISRWLWGVANRIITVAKRMRMVNYS